MNIKRFNNVLKVGTDITKEDFDKVVKINGPSFLKDENDKAIFRVDYGPQGAISKFGIKFDNVDAENKMFISVEVGTEATTKEIVEELYKPLSHLRDWEAMMQTQVGETTEAVNTIMDSITEVE